MADTRLKDRVKGAPFSLTIRNDNELAVMDFEDTPVYLFFERADNGSRVKLTYVPGGGSNDGVLTTDGDGVQRVTFTKAAEWTREAANLPAGLYSVWPWFGALTGSGALVRPERVALMMVKYPESGQALS